MTAISTAILIIFAVMGIIYCVREITYFLYKKQKNNCSIIIVTPLEGEKSKCRIYIARCGVKIKMVLSWR